jgi:hypothetical protein
VEEEEPVWEQAQVQVQVQAQMQVQVQAQMQVQGQVHSLLGLPAEADTTHLLVAAQAPTAAIVATNPMARSAMIFSQSRLIRYL